MPKNASICVLDTINDKNCQQYDQKFNCISCKGGFMFRLNSDDISVCDQKQKDSMCITYNL